MSSLFFPTITVRTSLSGLLTAPCRSPSWAQRGLYGFVFSKIAVQLALCLRSKFTFWVDESNSLDGNTVYTQLKWCFSTVDKSILRNELFSVEAILSLVSFRVDWLEFKLNALRKLLRNRLPWDVFVELLAIFGLIILFR